MRWSGRTEEQWWDDVRHGQRKFAWLPEQMHDGTWVWWEPYFDRFIPTPGGLGFWVRATTFEDLPYILPPPPTLPREGSYRSPPPAKK